MNEPRSKAAHDIVNRGLLIPYAVPYFAYVGIASFIASFGGGWLNEEVGYVLKILVVPGLMLWAWKWYVPVFGPKDRMESVWAGIAVGVIGLLVWLLLMAPFIDIVGEPWEPVPFFLRMFSATLIVPVFEEYFIRGYFLRAAYQWDMNRKTMSAKEALLRTLDEDNIKTVPPGAWSVAAVAISTIAFTVGHLPAEWPAAIAYSLLMTALWVVRKDLLSCMVAHATTNLMLALYCYFTGDWGFW